MCRCFDLLFSSSSLDPQENPRSLASILGLSVSILQVCEGFRVIVIEVLKCVITWILQDLVALAIEIDVILVIWMASYWDPLSVIVYICIYKCQRLFIAMCGPLLVSCWLLCIYGWWALDLHPPSHIDMYVHIVKISICFLEFLGLGRWLVTLFAPPPAPVSAVCPFGFLLWVPMYIWMISTWLISPLIIYTCIWICQIYVCVFS